MVSIQVGTFKIPQAAPGVQKLLQKTVVGRQVIKQQRPAIVPTQSTVVSGIWSGPAIVHDVIRDPLGTVIEGISHTMFGTKEQQVMQAAKWIPAAVETKSPGGDIQRTPAVVHVKSIIDKQKEQVGGKEFWQGQGAALPPIAVTMPEFPDIFGGLKDIGKWVLIGGAVILGAVVLMKLGGKK